MRAIIDTFRSNTKSHISKHPVEYFQFQAKFDIAYIVKILQSRHELLFTMASNDYTEWFPAQTAAQFSSLDSTLQSTNFSLPAIPEEDWDFGWGEDLFTDSDPYAVLEQGSNAVAESAPNLAVSPQVSQSLITLQEQVQQLGKEISELQVIFFERLESLENNVVAAQRYVEELVPWSKEVHEKYSKLLEVAKRQEDGAAESAQAQAQARATLATTT
jgi:hypothetical protein